MGGRGKWTKLEIFLNNSQIVEFTPRFNMMVVYLQISKKPMPRTEEYRADLRIFKKVYECWNKWKKKENH